MQYLQKRFAMLEQEEMVAGGRFGWLFPFLASQSEFSINY